MCLNYYLDFLREDRAMNLYISKIIQGSSAIVFLLAEEMKHVATTAQSRSLPAFCEMVLGSLFTMSLSIWLSPVKHDHRHELM